MWANLQNILYTYANQMAATRLIKFNAKYDNRRKHKPKTRTDQDIVAKRQQRDRS